MAHLTAAVGIMHGDCRCKPWLTGAALVGRAVALQVVRARHVAAVDQLGGDRAVHDEVVVQHLARHVPRHRLARQRRRRLTRAAVRGELARI